MKTKQHPFYISLTPAERAKLPKPDYRGTSWNWFQQWRKACAAQGLDTRYLRVGEVAWRKK